MQTVLIPTDFKNSSLDCIAELCDHFKDEKLNIVFIHLFKLSDSITDLLMLSRRSREYELVSNEFYDGCNRILARHPKIKSLKIEFFYGSTLSMFRSFLEANEVNSILDPAQCSVSKINKSSMDPALFVQKSGLPIITLPKRADHQVEYRIPTSAPAPRQEILTEA